MTLFEMGATLDAFVEHILCKNLVELLVFPVRLDKALLREYQHYEFQYSDTLYSKLSAILFRKQNRGWT
jgi:hypothetical protein